MDRPRPLFPSPFVDSSSPPSSTFHTLSFFLFVSLPASYRHFQLPPPSPPLSTFFLISPPRSSLSLSLSLRSLFFSSTSFVPSGLPRSAKEAEHQRILLSLRVLSASAITTYLSIWPHDISIMDNCSRLSLLARTLWDKNSFFYKERFLVISLLYL